MMTNPTSDLPVLADRLRACTLRLASLEGQINQLRLDRRTMGVELQEIKNRQAILEEVSTVFDALQSLVHQHTVGQYEALLNDFLHDVVPDAGHVRLEVGTSRASTSLDVLLEKPQGTEDVLNAQGGGVTNVIVAGLIYSALWRSPDHRRLVVLDEPDCWLKSIYVPALTRVLAQISDLGEDGFQTLMISHNDAALVDEAAHVHELHLKPALEHAKVLGLDARPCEDEAMAFAVRTKTGWEIVAHPQAKIPVITTRSGAKPWRDAAREGIRWIELINVQRHVCTRIECSPGLNVLTGDINSGKSTIFYTALRALAYGESSESMMTHGAQEMVIRVGLEHDRVVELVRRRSGSQKITYRLYEGAHLVHESPQGSRGTVPDAIRNVLRISRIDEMDVQLRSQKEPIFLLNLPDTRRANLLSVGQEVGYLKAMMDAHRTSVQRDRETQKRLEPQFERLRRIEQALLPLLGEAQTSKTLYESLLENLYAQQEALEQLKSLTQRLADPRPELKLPAAPVLPHLHDTEKITALGKTLRQTRAAWLDVPPCTVRIPLLHDTLHLGNVLDTLAQTQAAALSLPVWQGQVPRLHETGDLVDLAKRIKHTQGGRLRIPRDIPRIPVLNEVGWLAEFLRQAPAWANAIALAASLPRPPLVPEMRETQSLVKDFKELSEIRQKLAEGDRVSRLAKDEVAQITAQIEQFKRDIKMCPLCERPFEDQHV